MKNNQTSAINMKPLIPLEMIWNPKHDIDTYELALCIPYINGAYYPNEVNQLLNHFRHFDITNNNKKQPND